MKSLEFWGKPNPWIFALAGVFGAMAIIYYLLADHEMLFGEPRRTTTRWALGIAAFLLPVFLRRSISPLASATALLSGVVVAGTTWIFITGPGNLWPIAIALMVVFVAPPVGVGALMAFVVRLVGRYSSRRAVH